MKKKQLKNLAEQIADAEARLQKAPDKETATQYERQIIELTRQVSSIEEMLELDEQIQQILFNKLKEGKNNA